MKCVKVCSKKTGAGVAALVMAAAILGSAPVYAAGETGIDMSTDYPGITLKAGDTASFPLDFTSLDGKDYDVTLSTESLPEEWSGYFKGGNNQVTKVHVSGDGADSPEEDELAEYSLTIPGEAEEGTYTIELKADGGSGNTDTLELEINVSAVELGESNFTSEYPSQQGATGTTFTFDTTLVNNRTTGQSYSLSADAPEGWQVTYTPSGESANVASLAVEPAASQGVTVTVTPPENVEKGEYTIGCAAVSANDTLKMDLTVDITGTYSVNLSTPDQKLSFDAYAEKQSAVTLSITNTGNVDLENLNLTSSAPTDWEVEFSESTIDVLEAGATKEVTAYVTPGADAITGDYVTEISISNSAASAVADFRVSVKTPTTWGVAAAAIIVVLVAALTAIFKKYGRR